MPLSQDTLRAERGRIAQMVLDLVKERGTEISYAVALTESGLSRARPQTKKNHPRRGP